MQNDQIYSEILETIVTKEDLILLTGEIDLLENSLYKTKDSFEETLKTKIRSSIATLLIKLVAQSTPKDILKNLKTKLGQLKFLQVTFAHEPTKAILESLKKPRLCLDVHVNQEIIGGACFSFAGKYLDFSLKKNLEEILNG